MGASGEKPLSTRRMRACGCGLGGARAQTPDPILSSCGELLELYTNLLAQRERGSRGQINILSPSQRVACERVTVGWVVVRERGHPILSSYGELLELPSYLLAQSAGREDRYTIGI
jgi:hypothetical protein